MGPKQNKKKRREKADQAFYLLNFDCVPFCFVVVGEKVSFHGLPMRMIPRGTAKQIGCYTSLCPLPSIDSIISDDSRVEKYTFYLGKFKYTQQT